MKYTYYQLGIMAAVVSFLGFVVENIWLAMTKGYINNRNMNAPFLLGYGLLILFMYAVFGTPAALRMFTKEKVRWKRYLVYFLCSFAVVCVGEIVLGIAVEALCHIEYWNYSNIPMHITKYTSIPTSTAFAAMITILMGNVFPVLMDWICRINTQWAKIICAGHTQKIHSGNTAANGYRNQRMQLFSHPYGTDGNQHHIRCRKKACPAGSCHACRINTDSILL
jgi:uncharacterized membrane protein